MIRKAKLKDAKSIFSLINIYSAKGQMLHRSVEEITHKINGFLVYERNKNIAGACSLKYAWNQLVEIRSLAVLPNYCRRGL